MAVVNILAWVIVGGIASWLAGLVVQGWALSATSSSALSASSAR
jgi:hypothetical protein